MSATTTNSVLTEVSSSTRRPQRPPPLPRHFTTSVVTMCWVDSFTSTTRWPRSQAVFGHDGSHIAGDMRLIDRSSKSLRGVASTSRFEGRTGRALRQARRAPLSAHQYDGEVPNQTGIALGDRHFGALHHSADRRGRRSRYALTTLTRKNPGSARSHFKAQGPQQPRARKRAIGPHSPRSIGGSRLNATDQPQSLLRVSIRHFGATPWTT